MESIYTEISSMLRSNTEVGADVSQKEIWTDFIYHEIKDKLSKDKSAHIWFYHCLARLQYRVTNEYPNMDILREYMSAYCDAMDRLIAEGFNFDRLLCFSFN